MVAVSDVVPFLTPFLPPFFGIDGSNPDADARFSYESRQVKG
jgi:hypothetical protein